MIDPFSRCRQERTEYGKEVARLKASGECQDVETLVEENFFYCTEKHFKGLQNAVVRNIGNILIKEGLQIEKGAGLRVNLALADYVDRLGKNATSRKIQKW